jgi:hypothetical protein
VISCLLAGESPKRCLEPSASSRVPSSIESSHIPLAPTSFPSFASASAALGWAGRDPATQSRWLHRAKKALQLGHVLLADRFEE